MGALIRASDWTATGLGEPDGWPQPLRQLVNICLVSRFPMVIYWGPDFINIYNDAFRPLLGARHSDALGQPAHRVWPEIWPTIGPMLNGVMDDGVATWAENQVFLLERNGYPEECYFTFSCSPIDNETGGVGGVCCIVAETTQPVRQTRLTQHLFAQAPVAIAILRGPDLVFDMANDLYLTMVGRPSPDALVGLPLLTALPELRGHGFDTLLQQVMETGVAFTAKERPVDLLRNGQMETGYFNVVYEPLREAGQDGQAGISRVFIVVSEVTGQVLAQQRAYQLLVRERELNELKSNFVTLASHEFRTPMGTILSSAALIGRYDGPDDAAKRERHVQRIKAAVHSLTGLLNDFLSLSQMEQTTLHGKPLPMNIRTFSEELIDDIQAVVKPGQRIQYQHVAGDDDLAIDGQMLRNILVNLLMNASKYSAAHSDVELTTEVADGQLVVTVKDQGIGIPDTDKDKLFISFFRARNANHIEGTGLGLYVVKRYVDLLGGTITFASELDSGTIFTVRLPLAPLPA